VGDALSLPLWFVLFVLAASLFGSGKFTVPGSFERAVSYFFWGFVFLTLLNTNLTALSQFMISEQAVGTLEQILLTPASRVALLAGRWIRVILTDLLVIAATMVFMFAVIKTGILMVNPIPVILIIVMLEFALLGAGMLLAGISLRIRSVAIYINYSWLAIMIFSGVFFPASAIPQPFEIISFILPTTYFVDAIKYFAVGTPTLISPNLEIGLLITFTIGFFAAGLFIFRLLERNAKKRGQLSFS
jgi:ABC-2 type transport system permease protein